LEEILSEKGQYTVEVMCTIYHAPFIPPEATERFTIEFVIETGLASRKAPSNRSFVGDARPQRILGWEHD
jgi:hypothetical protein